MATNEIKNDMVEAAPVVEETPETNEAAKVPFLKRVWNGIKAHKTPVIIGGAAAALTGLGFAAKKLIGEKTGVELDIPTPEVDLGGLGGPEA